MTQNSLGCAAQRAEFEKGPMFGPQHNQINFVATGGKDDLFGGIAFQHYLRDAASAPHIFGNPLAQMLACSVAVRSLALDGLQHP